MIDPNDVAGVLRAESGVADANATALSLRQNLKDCKTALNGLDDEVQRLIKGLHMCDAITFAAVQPSACGRASHRCGPSDARALRAGLRA